jgi:hypothetical protein
VSHLSAARQREPTGRERADDADADSNGRARVGYGQSNAAPRIILSALWRKNVSSSVCRAADAQREGREGRTRRNSDQPKRDESLAQLIDVTVPCTTTCSNAGPDRRIPSSKSCAIARDDDSHQENRRTDRQRHGEEHQDTLSSSPTSSGAAAEFPDEGINLKWIERTS